MTNRVLFLLWNLQHSSWEVSWFSYRFRPVMLCSEANYWIDSYTIKTWRNHCSNIFSSFLLLLIDLIQNYLKQYPHLYSYRHLLTETAREKVYMPPKWFKTLRKTTFMESTNQQRHLKKSPRQLLSREFSKILMVSIQHYAWKWLFLFWILDYKSTITNMCLNKGILTKGMLFFDIWSKWL